MGGCFLGMDESQQRQEMIHWAGHWLSVWWCLLFSSGSSFAIGGSDIIVKKMTANRLVINRNGCWPFLTLMRAGELCSNGEGWRPGCISAGGGTEVMLWARTSDVDKGYGGPRCGAWDVGVGGTRVGWGWARARVGGGWVLGAARACGVVEGEEKPRVCGVVEGDDESCPESDLVIRPGKKNVNKMIKPQIENTSCVIQTYFKTCMIIKL